MMFVLKVGEEDAVLNEAQMRSLLEILWGASVKKQEWVGSGQGDDGENYSSTLRPYVPQSMLRPYVMHEDAVEALRVKTQLFDENKKRSK